jgi:hypothetical protein
MSAATSPLHYMLSWCAVGQLYPHFTLFQQFSHTKLLLRIKKRWLLKAVKSLFYTDDHLRIVSVKVTNMCSLTSYFLHSVKLEHNDKFTSNFFWLKAYCH